MRHRNQGRKLNRTSAHRLAMLRNLVGSLFLLEPEEGQPRRVTTTVPKAKEARRVAERLITLGKRGTLHARRQALALLQSKRGVKTLFETIAPLYIDRHGGYTRILRLASFRRGDGADLCYFELVSEPVAAAVQAPEPVAPRRVDEPAQEAEAREPAGQEEPREPGGSDAEE